MGSRQDAQFFPVVSGFEFEGFEEEEVEEAAAAEGFDEAADVDDAVPGGGFLSLSSRS